MFLNHYMCLGSKIENANFLSDEKIVENKKETTYLGVSIDKLENFAKSTSQKISILSLK